MSDAMAVVETYVSTVSGIPAAALRGPRRVEPVSRWRAVAIYLGHTTFGVSLSDAGAYFGRDRTTARHHVETVEEGRAGLTDQLLDHLDVGVREFRRALELVGRLAPLRAPGTLADRLG